MASEGLKLDQGMIVSLQDDMHTVYIYVSVRKRSRVRDSTVRCSALQLFRILIISIGRQYLGELRVQALATIGNMCLLHSGPDLDRPGPGPGSRT